MTTLPSNAVQPRPVLEDAAKVKRELVHDLSNALEIIIQTSFLLGMLDLGENGKTWHRMLDEGVQKAVAINKQLRDAIRLEERT